MKNAIPALEDILPQLCKNKDQGIQDMLANNVNNILQVNKIGREGKDYLQSTVELYSEMSQIDAYKVLRVMLPLYLNGKTDHRGHKSVPGELRLGWLYYEALDAQQSDALNVNWLYSWLRGDL